MSENSLALVTGASRGIGASIAKQLAQDGFYVLINYSRSENKARKVLEEIESKGGQGDLLHFDVSQPDEVQEAFQGIQKNHGGLSVCVNNAGISIDSLLLRIKNEDLDKVLDTNLKGTIYCSKEAAKLMMKKRQGSIIQMSSVIGQRGNAGQAAYASAKGGIISFSKSMAQELAARHVRVNVIAPGFISTDMTENLNEEQKEAVKKQIPMGNVGTPEDVSGVASFLASEKSRYMTGQVLGVNGGLYM